MLRWSHLIPWAFRAWPVLAIVPVGIAHYVALSMLPSSATIVNKLMGMLLQILGGLLVLYSVNDNLGLFRAQSLTATVMAWLKSFPIVRKPILLSTNARAMASAKATLSATVTRASTTIEERVAALERDMNELQSQLQREVQAISGRLEAAKTELQGQINEATHRVSDLSGRLEHAAVGGFKFQALGVLLAIYGAVTSVFA